MMETAFFRAVSQAISGTQKNQRKIRLAVVKQLESDPVAYKSRLREVNVSVAEYLRKSRMRYVGTWATEIEIQAAADSLGVSIFKYYNEQWLEHACQKRQVSNQAVYLKNCSGNHYDNVVSPKA